jgi:hypothetical protein
VPTLYARTLRRAADLAGGEAGLARRLGVSDKEVHLWVRGLIDPPADVFLAAAEIVTQDELTALRETQPAEPEKPPGRSNPE